MTDSKEKQKIHPQKTQEKNVQRDQGSRKEMPPSIIALNCLSAWSVL